jgi:hypothetical protein
MPLTDSNRSRRLKRSMSAHCEAIERRLMLSVGAMTSTVPYPVPSDDLVVLQSGLGTPDGYSTPNGAPLTPAKMRDAYGLGNFNASNVTFNGVQGTGAGQTIAIIEGGSDPDIAADVVAFDDYWSLPAPPSLEQFNATGGTTLPAVGDVGELDLDVEWAHVMAPLASIDLFDGNLYTGISTAAKTTGVSIITVSYTISGTEGVSEFETPAGHTGVTVLASAGDTGGEVNDPAKSPAVVAVGGTDLTLSGNNYSKETAWADTGGGINTAEAQPAYQKGIVSAYSTTNRTTPDVAMDAGPGTGVAVYDEYNNGTTDPWSAIIGGTSLSSPLMAGLIAVADQGRALAGLTPMDGYTQTLPRLYDLYTDDYADNYHDITSGSNGSPAGVGYDLDTGLGSPKANELVPDLAGADTITGRVFTDTNGNGVYDGSDTPLTGKTVYLDINDTGAQTSTDPTAVTNSSGGYIFTDQVGSETGVVRLATLPSGDLHSTTPNTYTTSYDQTQTVNLGLYPSTYVAAASPATVTGKTTVLSVTGSAPSDAASFIYTWKLASGPAGATPIFTANGTNAAQQTAVTFTEAGSYTFTVTISDGQLGSVTSNVNVTVMQTISSITIAPPGPAVSDGQTQQLTATGFDQFGDPMSPQPAIIWSESGASVGSLSSSGLYTAPASGGGTATVQASSGSISGSTTVFVIPTVINGTTSADTIRVVRSGAYLQIYLNNPATPALTDAFALFSSLTINGNGGNDSINIDFSGGASPVPAGGLFVNGTAGDVGDTLIVTGTNTNDSAIINSSTITLNSSTISYNGFESIIFNGNGGSDSLTQTAQPGNSAALVFDGSTTGGTSSSDTLNVNAGTFTFPPPNAGTGLVPLDLAAINIGGGTVVLPSAAILTDRWVLTVGSLAITAGQLNLGGSDMIVHDGDINAISDALQTGFANGFWNGPGIASTAAQSDPTQLTSLGMLSNNTGTGTLYSSFDNQPAVATDVFVKYTYYGDANLDGIVDGSDYSRIDNGFLTGMNGWANGDFNYDRQLDGSYYTLIDNAFNRQGVSLAAEIFATESASEESKSDAAANRPSSAAISARPDSTSAAISPAANVKSNDALFLKWYEGSLADRTGSASFI